MSSTTALKSRPCSHHHLYLKLKPHHHLFCSPANRAINTTSN
uniref:Uncharacterized protein n=1 Tax=Chenopodium quinoa TaxID=63459 RepID=A0A803MGQ1_CHEQI